MKRIYITGCARSGTTLMNRLFYAFKDMTVIDYEIDLDAFCEFNYSTRYLVGKRTPLTVFSVPLEEHEIDRQLDKIQQEGLFIVNMIRDGRDVVHMNPKGPQVNVNRWIGCIIQSQLYRNIVNIQVRYEDLVKEPDLTQKKICSTLDVEPLYKFSDYPDYIPEETFNEPEYREFRNYDKRKISCASVGHSSHDYICRCESDDQRIQFERILKKSGYTSKESEEIWDKGFLEKEIEQHKRDSIRLGFIRNSR